MAKRTRRLRVETLEDRCVPATWGNPWLDSEHWTLSFAPDDASHVCALDDGAAAASDMSAAYSGIRTRLTARGISALQTLYGPRPPDAYEGTNGNNPFATAASIGLSGTPHGLVNADI